MTVKGYGRLPQRPCRGGRRIRLRPASCERLTQVTKIRKLCLQGRCGKRPYNGGSATTDYG